MPRRPAFDLTRSFAALAPGEYADAAVTGLTLRVRDSGRRTFVLRYLDRDGRSVKYKLGEFPNLSLAQARKLARALSGGDPQAERRAQRARRKRPGDVRTVAELIDRYLERAETRMRPSSFKVARQRLNAHVRPALGAMRVGEVRADVRALMAELQRHGLGVTSNRCATALGAAYRFAQRALDMDVRNPLDGIDRDDRFRETPRQRILTGDEVRRLWRACETIDALLRGSEADCRGASRPASHGSQALMLLPPSPQSENRYPSGRTMWSRWRSAGHELLCDLVPEGVRVLVSGASVDAKKVI